VRADELERLAEELGLDAIGVARAEPYAETDGIRERRARGLFADMRFTMARPESRASRDAAAGLCPSSPAALCYYAPEGGVCRHGRLPAPPGTTPMRSSASGSTRSGAGCAMTQAAARSGSRRDANQRRPRSAARSGVGFYGKNTPDHAPAPGSSSTLVTDLELERTPPLDADWRRVPALHRRLPDGRAHEPGALDSTRCLSYWTQAAVPAPEPYREQPGAQVYGCDICRTSARGTAASSDGERPGSPGRRVHSLASTGFRRPGDLRNASCGLRSAQRGRCRVGTRWWCRQRRRRGGASAVAPCLEDDDDVLREYAAWALSRMDARSG
jgi:hypothetical protein